ALAFHKEGRAKLGMMGEISVCAAPWHGDNNGAGERTAAGIAELPSDNERHSRIGKSSLLNRLFASQNSLNAVFAIRGSLLEQRADFCPNRCVRGIAKQNRRCSACGPELSVPRGNLCWAWLAIDWAELDQTRAYKEDS